jgi:glucokinase
VDVSGVLRSAPNLDARDVGFDLRAELAGPLVDLLGARAAPRPVALGNDATAAAFGEVRLGAGRGFDDVFVVSIGTGIGAGYVAGGRLVRGARGFAGEIGHMVIDPDGPPCPCGRSGCWEQFASGLGLAWIATRDGAVGGLIAEIAGDRAVRGEDVVEAVRRGDRHATAIIETYAAYLAIGLVNATEILDPEIIVLGGGIITASDVVLAPTRRAFERLSRPAQQRTGSDLVPATLGARAAAIGMGLDALEPEVADRP